MSAPTPSAGRARLALLLIVPILTMVAGFVGQALAPKLLVEQPALLVALDPRPTYLLLAAPSVPWALFIAIGALRWLVADPFFFIIGSERGPAAIAWVEARSGKLGRRSLGLLRRVVDKAAIPIVFFAAGPLVCLLIGMSGRMSVRRFAIVNVVGTLSTMVGFRLMGMHFADPLQRLTAIIADHAAALTAVTCLGVAVSVALRWRRGMAGAGA